MGVLRLVLTAVRGAGTAGIAAVDRLGAEPPAPLRVASARRVRARDNDGAHLVPVFPSQSESAALLDAYLGPEHAPMR